MAAALMPALATGGRAALSYLPSIVDTVKKNAPAAYAKLQEYTGKSNQTPELLAEKAKKGGDRYLGQALIESMLRNGVRADMITQAAPIFTEADLKMIQVEFVRTDMAERAMAQSHVHRPDGEKTVIVEAHIANHIERVAEAFSVSSSALSDLMAFLAAVGPNDIANYQAYERSRGRKPK